MNSQPIVLVERLRSRSSSIASTASTLIILLPDLIPEDLKLPIKSAAQSSLPAAQPTLLATQTSLPAAQPTLVTTQSSLPAAQPTILATQSTLPAAQPTLPAPKVPPRKKRDQKRFHHMCLRSRRPSQLKYKSIANGSQLTPKRKTSSHKVPNIINQFDTPPSDSSYTLDDFRPLTYFANCSTPSTPAPFQIPEQLSPEPVAGPSGMQTIPDPVAMLINSKGIIMPQAAHYRIPANVENWIDNTACVARDWSYVQELFDAPEDQLDSRCAECDRCEIVTNLIELSTLLKTYVKFDLTGDETAQIEDKDMDNDYIYLELLPKHPSIMMKIKRSLVNDKEVYSAYLIPRSDARKSTEMLLIELKGPMHQLIETLKNNILKGNGRRMSMSSVCSDRRNKVEEVMNLNILAHEATKLKQRLKQKAAEVRLADMTDLQVRIKAEKEEEVSRVLAEKSAEVSRIEAEKVAEVTRIQREKEAEVLRVREEYEIILRAQTDKQADVLDREPDAKDMGSSDPADPNAPGPSGVVTPEGGKLVDAPIFRPTKEEFNDPIAYFETIKREASRYAICKIVPPPGWKQKCKFDEEISFDVSNQYISRMFNRWGPAARELCGIKLCLQQQGISFLHPPKIDDVEVNLPKLYHLVQRHGGLQTVLNKKRWGRVAEEMKFGRAPNIEQKLDQIYVKYLLPYESLSHEERLDIMRKVEKAWNRKNQILLDRAMNPLYRQKRMLGQPQYSDAETEDVNIAAVLHEAKDCVIQGSLMNPAKFKRLATNAYENLFGQNSESPSVTQIEEKYWHLLQLGTEHVCVYSADIDTGGEGYGFCRSGRHPWNLKNMTQLPGNLLRYLGPMLRASAPTLHLGMLYSTSCWHKSPHALPLIDYQHTGSTRIWYGIPRDQTDNFRKAVETLCPTFCQNKDMWLASNVAMIPVRLLRDHNVTLTRVTQEKGEFIMTFPRAYTSSICTGYTESESVYFAPQSWLQTLPEVFNEARRSCEPTLFPMEQLLLLIAKDQNTDISVLKIILPTYDKMLRDEVTNRQMLQEKGLKFIHEMQSTGPPTSRRRTNESSSGRDQGVCKFCKATLFLSKVKHLVSRNSTLCLEHALQLLDSDKYKDRRVDDLEVIIFVSAKELNTVWDNIRRRVEAL